MVVSDVPSASLTASPDIAIFMLAATSRDAGMVLTGASLTAERGARRNELRAVGHLVGEFDRGVVVRRRRIGPGAVVVVEERARAGRDLQIGRHQRRTVEIAGVDQQFGLRDQPRAGVS